MSTRDSGSVPLQFNSWIMPLSGKIWDAYNYTMCFFKQEAEKLILRGEVSNHDTEVVQPESEDEETVVVYQCTTRTMSVLSLIGE